MMTSSPLRHNTESAHGILITQTQGGGHRRRGTIDIHSFLATGDEVGGVSVRRVTGEGKNREGSGKTSCIGTGS